MGSPPSQPLWPQVQGAVEGQRAHLVLEHKEARSSPMHLPAHGPQRSPWVLSFLQLPCYPSPHLEGGEAGGGDSDPRLEGMKSQSGNLEKSLQR